MIRILLIGPLPPPMGGDTRHFETLVQDLSNHVGFSIRLINTSRGAEHSNPRRNILMALNTMWTVVSNVIHADVISFHASDRGMLYFGPFIVAVGKLAGKPTVLRLFGGSFGDCYEKRGKIGKAIIRSFILSADVILLQTRRMITQLHTHAGGRLEWFSTYIKVGDHAGTEKRGKGGDERRACTHFVFLGHLWRTKGMETLLQAADRLPGDCRIDIYGPQDEYTADDILKRGSGRVRYGGFLTHAEVDAKLWEYDCLVLPTYHRGEGYPGVIAEAFAHGLPVITTNWQAIPEIVDDECGILIDPENTDAFVNAVTAMHQDPHRWQRLKDGALNKSRQFDHAIWARKYEDICEQLVRQ